MMDVSLLTSNATQLRAVMSNPHQEFYVLLLWLIASSIVLQVLSSILHLTSDFFKTHVKEKDIQSQEKRRLLDFISLAMVMITTALNVLISAFYTPSAVQQVVVNKVNSETPVFSQADITSSTSHTEL